MGRNLKSRNRMLAGISFAGAAAMVGAAFAAVPLYEVFCQVTGYGGATQIASNLPSQTLDRTIMIRFNADVDRKLPWVVNPVQDSINVKVGENRLAFYRAKNLSQKPITGTAAFNVTPAKAGLYFSKIDCFCFTEQKLKAGAIVDMPVSFFVDPEIAKDPNLTDVTTITLSYSFFQSEHDVDRTVQIRKAPSYTDG